MAVLARRATISVVLGLLLCGCSVVDPLVVSERYSVTQEGQAKIKVRIEGGDGVSRLALRDVIHDYMLDLSRDPARDSAAFDAMLELEDLFEQNGFPLVSVKYRIERVKGTKVVFTIQQNNRVILEKCRIEGGPIDSKVLLSYLPRRTSEVLGLGEDLYVAADIETLRRGILNHYRRVGYLDVSTAIEGPTPKLTLETARASVIVRVTPGELFRVGEIVIDDALAKIFAKNAAELGRSEEPAPGPVAPRSPLEAGKPFQTHDVQDYGLAVTNYLRNWGYPEPQIRTTVTAFRPPAENPHTVSIRLHGAAGEPVVVDRIDIEGQDFASETNIRQRITLEAGKRFDGSKEEASLLRLYRSGLFRTIETQYQPAGPGRIVVVFKVRETTRYLVQPLIGAGSYERIRGGLEFEMLSLFGTDFDFNSTGIVSDKGHRMVASIADSEFWPALFGDDTTLSIALDDFRREEPSYTDGATGISPSISKLFTRTLSARIGYLIRDHGGTFSSVIDPGAQIGDYREGSLIFEIAYDSRDNPVMPKNGMRIALQHKWADDSLGGEVSFHRTRLSLSKIFELTERTRFVVRGEAGILEPESNLDSIPIQERFFNGGESTVRSFREDQLAIANLRDINGQVIGGGYRNVLNAELRWAPRFRPFNAFDLEFAIFGDAGNLGRRTADYDFGELKYAVGAGVRFLLPIGPVRFDYAHNPDREPGERDWTFHFSIGYAF